MTLRLRRVIRVALLLALALAAVVSGVSENAEAQGGFDGGVEATQASGLPCPDVGGMAADVDPRRVQIEPGERARFSVALSDSYCPERLHVVTVCVEGHRRVNQDFHLAHRCVSPPPFAATSTPQSFRLRAAEQASGKYALTFTVTESFQIPDPPGVQESQVASARGTVRVIPNK